MNRSEPAPAGLFDHEDEIAPAGRRRQAPDWGGDDLFTSMPGRRFDRDARATGHDADVEHADAGVEHLDWTLRRPTDDRSERARRRDTMEHPVQRRRRPPIDASLQDRSPLELPDVTERTIALPEGATAPVAEGRRTVTITGHPDRVPARRRPAPSLDERLVGRNPERIAMYAFALGLLLIVIAFLSANA
jgi:hypothetical protein